tara:strand:+ start:2668 stop:3015 length:348 start_codon:yes stop_codon:yes gene_type:complete
MSNLSELLPAGAGAKSATFVASGTLASGQTVALKSDGTVEAASANYTAFIGITDQAIANGASGKVVVQGGVNSKVVNLTNRESTYYVQSNGTLSTTVTAVPAGRALTNSSILLEG